ncbi:MAG: hypothetical protein WCS69_12405, partial [Ignavibacteriaceae bacterium]
PRLAMVRRFCYIKNQISLIVILKFLIFSPSCTEDFSHIENQISLIVVLKFLIQTSAFNLQLSTFH